MNPTYKEITCTTACHKIQTNNLPYRWDLNVYRGCGHLCKYCFAMYSHKYLGTENYFGEIFIKTNIVEQLEKQLRSKSWNGGIINLGGVTDNYQPAEEKYKLMPEILKLLIKYKNPAVISSKSDLILRDYDLIAELSKLTYVNVAATITTVDEGIREMIEPGGVSTARRFAMLKEFSKTNASRGMHVMPILPFITDTQENMEGLYMKAKETGVNYALLSPLNLMGQTRAVYLNFIKEKFPKLYDKYIKLFKSKYVDKEYASQLNRLVKPIREKYGISNGYKHPMKEKLKEKSNPQLSLFDSYPD